MNDPNPPKAPAPAKAAQENDAYMVEVEHYDHVKAAWFTAWVSSGLSLLNAENTFNELSEIQPKQPQRLQIRRRTDQPTKYLLKMLSRPGLSQRMRDFYLNLKVPVLWEYSAPVRSATLTP